MINPTRGSGALLWVGRRAFCGVAGSAATRNDMGASWKIEEEEEEEEEVEEEEEGEGEDGEKKEKKKKKKESEEEDRREQSRTWFIASTSTPFHLLTVFIPYSFLDYCSSSYRRSMPNASGYWAG